MEGSVAIPISRLIQLLWPRFAAAAAAAAAAVLIVKAANVNSELLRRAGREAAGRRVAS